MDRVLVTGGAGYIGSHACKALSRAGFEPVTFDNLSTGWADAVKFGPLEDGNLLDRARIDTVFAKHQPIAVMHFAALSQVGDSMKDPGLYWRENVTGALNLIEAAVAADCKRFVFSSTCATYGDQDGVVLDEDSVQIPINAYGASKQAIEQILSNFEATYDLQHVIFRYFNVAGADPDGEIGEFHRPETHLIPLILQAIDGQRPALTVFGTDYPTPDGTCIRDYVHVSDLVDAHVSGLKWLIDGKGSRAFNLGTGSGFSVREVLENARRATNRDIPIEYGERRPGDATSLVSGSSRASSELGWTPHRSNMKQMISDAWQWHQSGDYKQ
ncbi:MAG: UDP-glucose 4-epimerase GalE [Dinoroseobacter sp.]|nr:UDP-glucose 4-epimerase GalE [Dinoroseobacter sp.]